MVIKDNDGKWCVHPAPDASPFLSIERTVLFSGRFAEMIFPGRRTGKLRLDPVSLGVLS
jgi:hypothetical protein